MRHLSEGVLRRIYDEPLALAATEQGHYETCPECKGRFEVTANQARSTAALLSLPAFEADARQALLRLRRRIAEDEARRPVRWYERWLAPSPAWRRVGAPVAAVALAAALVASFSATGVLPSLIKVFEPRTVTPVTVSPSNFPSGAALLDFGTTTWNPGPPQAEQVSDAATASRLSGLPVLTPAALPAGVSGPVSYGVIGHTTGALTLDAARLRASAASRGVKINPMPASLDHSTIYVNGGPALLEIWGAPGAGTGTGAPTLVIAQTRIPTVESSGASTQQLEDYLLSQPGVPPELAAQLRAIKDPSTTLPIPIPAGFATTKPVTINGVQGLLIDAGIAAGVVWEKGNVIYAVGGQLTPEQVIALASSLH